jgi:hypothetical protein
LNGISERDVLAVAARIPSAEIGADYFRAAHLSGVNGNVRFYSK